MKQAPSYEQETFAQNGNHLDRPGGIPRLSPHHPAPAGPLKNVPLMTGGVSFLIFALFAWYVWPTPYETFAQNGTMVRINRFTGETQSLQSTGWILTSHAAPQALLDDHLGALSVDISEIRRGDLHTRIYNGTDYRLTSITLLLTILDKNHATKLERAYLAYPEDSGNGDAYGDSGFGARCSVALLPGETYRLKIAGATGTVTPGLASVNVATGSHATAPAAAPAAPVMKTNPPVAVVPPKPSVPAPPAVVAAAAPKQIAAVPAAPTHSMPLNAGAAPPRPVPPFHSAIVAPRMIASLPTIPSAVSPSVLTDPDKTGGLTPLQISSLQQRYDTYKHDGTLSSDPKIEAWSLAALARNLVHDDHKPDLSKVPTSILEDSLHMINTYSPKDFLK